MYLELLSPIGADARPEEARCANEAKSRFPGEHEPRVPHAAQRVVGMSEPLVTTELSNEQREYAEVIQASARSLLSLVEDVLDISWRSKPAS